MNSTTQRLLAGVAIMRSPDEPAAAPPTPDLAALTGQNAPAADPPVAPGGAVDTPPVPTEPPTQEEQETARRGAEARIAALTSEKWQERRQNAELQAQLAEAQRKMDELTNGQAYPPVQQPDPLAAPQARTYTEAEARQMAEGLARQQSAQGRFDHEVNTAIIEGRRGYQDFDASIESLRRFGPLPPYFVAAVLEAGQVAGTDEAKAADILYALGKDLTEADRILSLPPERQGVALAKFATHKAKPAGQTLVAPPASSAPPPVRSVVGGGGRSSFNPDDPNTDIKEWMKWRETQLAAQTR